MLRSLRPAALIPRACPAAIAAPEATQRRWRIERRYNSADRAFLQGTRSRVAMKPHKYFVTFALFTAAGYSVLRDES